MAGDEVRIPIHAVRGHSGSVDAAADGLDSARSAAAHVGLGGEAYGRICAFLPGLIDPIGGSVVSVLAEAASSVRETAAGLRTVAADAAATDRDAERRITSAGSALDLPL